MVMVVLVGSMGVPNAQASKGGTVPRGFVDVPVMASFPSFDCRDDHFIGTSGAPSRIASADLNNDGNLDVIVTDPDNARLLVIMNSFGGFMIGSDSATLASPYALSIADVDGDGDLDVATAVFGPGAVCISLNDGFGTLELTHVLPIVHQTNSAVLFDLDGDGDVDAAGSSFIGRNVCTFTNDGAGTFSFAADYPVGTYGGDYPRAVTVGDMDGDGKNDLVVALIANAISVLYGMGGGGFEPETPYPLNGGDTPRAVIVADIDEDLDLDVVRPHSLTSFLSTAINDGGRSFSMGASQLEIVSAAPWDAAVGDINGDGSPEVVTASGASSFISVVRSAANGGTRQDYAVAGNTYGICFSDVNNDRRLEILASGSGFFSVLSRGLPKCKINRSSPP
jgi:hypothetical protein